MTSGAGDPGAAGSPPDAAGAQATQSDSGSTRPLDAATVRLFGLEGEGWAARLRSAHAGPPLGRLGGYELVAELGRGGQGEVYKAIQPGTGRAVALKRIAGLGLTPSAKLLARFTREVDALTRLSHPGVVSVFALEVLDGHSLLVMECIDGTPIDQWADRQWALGAQPLTATLGVFAAVCDGVAHAHQRGVLHRDLKPSNVLVTAEGQPKVLDFGIARVLNDQAADGSAAAWTVTGFAGTPAYASPEQLRPSAAGIDTRSDVYSLGVLLFRILSGQEAFDTGRGIAALLESIGAGPIRPPSRVRAGLPGECDWIVRKAADPEPARRYQTVEALAEDVRRLLDGRTVLAHPPSAAYTLRRAIRRRPWLTLAAAVAAIAILTLSVTAAVQAARLTVRARDLARALHEATEARDRAERHEQQLTKLNRQLIELSPVTVADIHFLQNTDPDPVTALMQLAEQLAPEDDPEVVLNIRMRLGLALRREKRFAESEVQLGLAQEISERLDHPTSDRATRIAARRSQNLASQGQLDAALAIIDAAIERAAVGPATIYSASLYLYRLSNLVALRRPEAELLECARQFIAGCDAFPERRLERAQAREESARILYKRGLLAEPEQWTREALEIAASGGVGRQAVSRFQDDLATMLVARGRLEEAEPHARAAADHRIRTEGATGQRAGRYVRLHAQILQRLRRFAEASERWELALLRPLAAGKRDEQEIAGKRLRLAAARFGNGQEDVARMALALAVSKGTIVSASDPAVADDVARVEAALRASDWQITAGLKSRLGDLGWLAFTPDAVDPIEPDAPE